MKNIKSITILNCLIKTFNLAQQQQHHSPLFSGIAKKIIHY